MMIQEVMGAKYSASKKAYLINILSHKTNQVYGPAQIVLTKEEYTWALRFLEVKDKLPGGTTAKYFFFTSTPNPCKNLNNYFQEAWKYMDLPGTPTFTDIRTSIASHAKFTHGNDDREKISKFMCHDVKTADKFYVTNLSAKQAMEHRILFERSLEGEERSPAKPASAEPGADKKRQSKRKSTKPRKKKPKKRKRRGATRPPPPRMRSPARKRKRREKRLQGRNTPSNRAARGSC
nr:uncharacterized protein LOC129446123 [Misgurnus anguillicaudatus]